MKQAPDGLPMPSRLWAIVAIGLGITLSVLDGAIANVALPTIASDLQTTPTYSIWVVNAYQLAMTISILSMASIGDIYGYRKVYIGGLILFTCTSLFCALSTSLPMLIVARGLQGFGAAAITSVNTALVRIIYPTRFLSRGLGLNALIVSVASAAGPTIAALVLSITTWQWLFAVNIPIGIAAYYMSLRFLPTNTEKRNNRTFDKLGGLMNALTFALVIGVIEAFTHGFSLLLIVGAFIALMVIGYLYLHRESKKDYPIFPVDLLRIPIFALSVATSFISFLAQMLAMVSLPFFLQGAMGRDAVSTGLLITPWPLSTMIFAPLAGVLVTRINAGILGGIGLSIFAVGLFLLGNLSPHPSDLDIIWRIALCGAGFGLFQTPNNTTLISSAPRSRSGGASGTLSTTRLLGQTAGAALVALLFEHFPENGTHYSLLLASVVAVIAALVSLTRIGKSTPSAAAVS